MLVSLWRRPGCLAAHLLGTGKPCYPHNVGSDQAISIRELAFLVRQILSPQKELHIQKQGVSGIELRKQCVPSISRTKECFGLDAWTSLENTIKWTAVFHVAKVGTQTLS